MVTVRTWGNVDELRLLRHVDIVPFAFRYDARVTCTQFEAGTH